MNVGLTTCLAFVLCVYVSHAQLKAPVKELIHGGQVSGERISVPVGDKLVDLDVFYGIPYAVPPVGELRFSAPQKHEGWTGIKNATTPPPTCWQTFNRFSRPNAAVPMYSNNTEMSEDCLYLNVLVPADIDPSTPLPVMVWIYGGGNIFGSTTLDLYNASAMVAQNKIIFVSMQHRLGAFGYLRLKPGSGDEKSASLALGNQGLQDQMLALEWVHDNIEKFGGDPKAVTVFGQSSGSANAGLQWLSPKANEYFQRLILQSGGPGAWWAVDTAEEGERRGDQIVMGAGCQPITEGREATIECLQKADPVDLVKSLDAVRKFIMERRTKQIKELFAKGQDPVDPTQYFSWLRFVNYGEVTIKPIVDGDLIPKHPRDLLLEDEYPNLRKAPEVLVGTNKNEMYGLILLGFFLGNGSFLLENGSVAIPREMDLAAGREPLEPNGPLADFHRISATLFLNDDQIVPGVTQMAAFYYGLPMETENTTGYADPYDVKRTGLDVYSRMATMATDLQILCPLMDFAEQVAKIPNSKMFVYQFARQTESLGLPPYVGATHFQEIPYVMGMPFSDKFQNSFVKYNDDERQLSANMMRLWTNFAKYGDPNGKEGENSELPRWPIYQAAKDRNPDEPKDDHIILDVNITTARDLRLDACRFWLHQVPALLNTINSLKQPE